MPKRTKEVSATNYLKLNSRLEGILLNAKHEAKIQTGREFGTHAERGSGAYERMLRETLDIGIQLVKQRKNINNEEKDLICRRLIKDYNYGFNAREQERKNKEDIKDRPIMDKAKIVKRLNSFEDMKKENIKRVTEKFLGWRNRNDE